MDLFVHWAVWMPPYIFTYISPHPYDLLFWSKIFKSFVKIVNYRFAGSVFCLFLKKPGWWLYNSIIINWSSQAERTYFFPTRLGTEYATWMVQGKQLNMFCVLSHLAQNENEKHQPTHHTCAEDVNPDRFGNQSDTERLMSSLSFTCGGKNSRLSLFQVPMCLVFA